MHKEKVYLIKNINEYGKLIAYCINHDINVFRSYWDNRNKGRVCYHIDFLKKCLYYSDIDYYKKCPLFDIIIPEFDFDDFGNVIFKNKKG